MSRHAAAPRLVRLQRYLSQAGVAARRKAEQLILAGRVTVDGKVVKELGTKVDADHANVQVDGEAVSAQDHFYILLNKPKGCITAVTDDRGRLTVMDYLPNVPVSVAPVGRLDYYSEGVLLLTNDGELAARLLGPQHHVPKTYHVKIRGSATPRDLERLRDGVTLDDGTVTQPADVDVLRGESRHDWLVITLYEGKSRQIHRMLEALGHQVQKLQRVSFAGLTFHGLRVGDARELTQQELHELRESVGLDRTAIARGRWHAEREDTERTRRERMAAIAEAGAGGGDGAAMAAGPSTRPSLALGPAQDERGRGRVERGGAARVERGGAARMERDGARRREPTRATAGRGERATAGRGERATAGRGERTTAGRGERTTAGRDERAKPRWEKPAPGRAERAKPGRSKKPSRAPKPGRAEREGRRAAAGTGSGAGTGRSATRTGFAKKAGRAKGKRRPW